MRSMSRHLIATFRQKRGSKQPAHATEGTSILINSPFLLPQAQQPSSTELMLGKGSRPGACLSGLHQCLHQCCPSQPCPLSSQSMKTAAYAPSPIEFLISWTSEMP
eukprot:1150687-Pelagomonas_calceolata.AAC.4